MALHVMLDLETWSTAPNATLISIGAVKFDPWDTAAPMEGFHVGVDPGLLPPAVAKLFDISPSTIEWWMIEERAAARTAWLGLEKVDLPTALEGFALWMGGRMPVWANAPSFDCRILLESYRLLGLQAPFAYQDEMDYRTLKKLAPIASKPAEIGTAHDALADAQWQALHLQRILMALGIDEPAPPPPKAPEQGTYTLQGETHAIDLDGAPAGS